MSKRQKPGKKAAEETLADAQAGKTNLADSVALKRIIEEVRTEKAGGTTGYNRTYHRHNRS